MGRYPMIKKIPLIICGLFVLAPFIVTACARIQPKISEPRLKAAAQYKPGESPAALRAIEDQVLRMNAHDPQQAALENELLALARDSEAPIDVRIWACNQLQVIGSETSVHGLTKLLQEPRLFDVTRRAIERIAGEKSTAALRRALRRAKGRERAGLINSLAERNDERLPRLVGKDLGSDNSFVFETAADALGKLGTPAALRELEIALARARPAEEDAIRYAPTNPLKVTAENRARVLAENLLRCSDKIKLHNPDFAAAMYMNIYRRFNVERTGGPESTFTLRLVPVRMAALKGAAELAPNEALPEIIGLLRSDDQSTATRHSRLAAAQIARKIPGEQATRELAALLRSPHSDRALVFKILAKRNDPLVAGAVRNALATAWQDKEQPAIMAAIEALRRWPSADNVKSILSVAAEAGGPIRAAARDALNQMSGTESDRALREAAASGSNPVRVEALRALAMRPGPETVQVARSSAMDSDSQVRRAAAQTLAQSGSIDDLDFLLERFIAAPAQERPGWAQAIIAIPSRSKEEPTFKISIRQRFVEATDASLMQDLLMLLGQLDEEPVGTLGQIAQSGKTEWRQAASKALGVVRGQMVMPALEGLLAGEYKKKTKGAKLKQKRPAVNVANELAESYLKQIEARLVSDPATVTLQRLQFAQNHATTRSEQTRILSMAGRLPELAGQNLLVAALQNPDLAPEAATALVSAAEATIFSAPAAAQTALEAIPEKVLHKPELETTSDTVERLRRRGDYILYWQVAGPYVDAHFTTGSLLTAQFPPEFVSRDLAQWRPLAVGLHRGDPRRINMSGVVSGNPPAMALLRCAVWSPREQPARLLIGNDDAIAIMWNDQELAAFDEYQAVRADQHVLPVTLKQGWNRLLMKVSNYGNEWAYTVRLRSAEDPLPGKPLPELRIRTEW